MQRMKTKEVRIGNRVIGGRQSDPDPVHDQYKDRRCGGIRWHRSKDWTAAGCDIIRCAVPTMEAAAALA